MPTTVGVIVGGAVVAVGGTGVGDGRVGEGVDEGKETVGGAVVARAKAVGDRDGAGEFVAVESEMGERAWVAGTAVASSSTIGAAACVW